MLAGLLIGMMNKKARQPLQEDGPINPKKPNENKLILLQIY